MSENEPRMNRQFLERCLRIDRLYADYAKANGLTYMSFTVLSCICEHPEGCTQRQICDETFYPKQSVNLIVGGFRDQGYLELRELPSDHRNKLILLTPEGRKYTARIMDCVYTAEETCADRIPDAEWETFLHVLDTYADDFSRHMRQLIRTEDS